VATVRAVLRALVTENSPAEAVQRTARAPMGPAVLEAAQGFEIGRRQQVGAWLFQISSEALGQPIGSMFQQECGHGGVSIQF